jgi:DNA-directed RNA polymerase specialized sigma24 family protein
MVVDWQRETRSFPSTRWSLVAYAGQCRDGDPAALGELLSRYLPALKAHLVLKKGLEPDRVDDLLQGFVADKVIERNLLAAAQRRRGKFRTFLLTALDRYAWNKVRDERAQKRRPDELLSLDVDDADNQPAAAETAADPFDEIWARDVLAEVLRLMRQECEDSGRADIWGVFESRIVCPLLDGCEPMSYEQLVGRFGFESPIQASNVLMTAKRMFRRVLRSVVGEYTADKEAIEAEIAELRQILSRCGAES